MKYSETLETWGWSWWVFFEKKLFFFFFSFFEWMNADSEQHCHPQSSVCIAGLNHWFLSFSSLQQWHDGFGGRIHVIYDFDRSSWLSVAAAVVLTGMSLVSSSSAGTWRADRALRMAPRIFVASSAPKAFPGAIFKKRMTRSSPSALYWGTQRLSDTSSKASTAVGEGWRSRGGERQGWGRKVYGSNLLSFQSDVLTSLNEAKLCNSWMAAAKTI